MTQYKYPPSAYIRAFSVATMSAVLAKMSSKTEYNSLTYLLIGVAVVETIDGFLCLSLAEKLPKFPFDSFFKKQNQPSATTTVNAIQKNDSEKIVAGYMCQPS